MAPELQKPRVTEIQVPLDCYGCVQKIKKTLNGISGIKDLYIDFQQQKITIIGWADPEEIIKAIRKTRKSATIYSHVEQKESPSQPPVQAPNATQKLPADDPPAQPDQAATLAEPPQDIAPHEQPPEETALPKFTENSVNQQSQSTPKTKDDEEVDETYQHSPNYGIGNRYDSGHSYVGQWERYHKRPVFLQETAPPISVTHSYNTYQPSPYVTEYEYVRSQRHIYYNRMEQYSGDFYSDNGSLTSMFSDENPNACTIV